MKVKLKYFFSGLILGSIMFSGLSSAATWQNVKVLFTSAKIYFDEEYKPFGKGQTIFSYNGQLYVPLSYMTANLNKPLTYDAKTNSWYIGKRKVVGSQEKAVELAVKYVKNSTLYNVEKLSFIVEGEDNLSFRIRVYEDLSDHIATVMWLTVDKYTGEVKDASSF